jgi:hypothetical protein
MVEVRIEEMFRSDGSRPLDYKRAVVVDAEKRENERENLFQVKRKKCLRKELDRGRHC